MLTVAVQSGNEIQQMNARMWAMIDHHHLGNLLIAQEYADACIPMGTQANQPARLTSIFDPIVATLAESSRNLWMLGDSRESLARTRRALAVAREIRHPDSLSFALLFHGWMHGYRGEWEICLQSTAEAIAFGSEHGLVQTLAWNRCVHGWALAHTGRTSDGLAELQSAIEDSMRIMGHVAMGAFFAMLAEVLIIRGEHARALDEIQRILTANETTRDKYFNAELQRLAAECHLALGEPEAAEAALESAIEIARSQRALTFELRATTAWGRLWAERNGTGRARQRLQEILDKLGDAEETADVRCARACVMQWTSR